MSEEIHPASVPKSAAADARLRLGVLVSGQGRGTNLQAILDACAASPDAEHAIPAEVVVVIGTRRDAPALERAVAQGVETVVISPRRYQETQPEDAPPGTADAAYGQAILRVLRSRGVELVCLAGYMRILPPNVVRAFPARVMNIHPALLPLFGGRGMFGENVHRAAIESGMKVTGCTVHFVDEQYDTGPIIAQRVVAIAEDDTPQTLAARLLPEEHHAYREAIRRFAEGRLLMEGRRVRILPSSGRKETHE